MAWRRSLQTGQHQRKQDIKAKNIATRAKATVNLTQQIHLKRYRLLCFAFIWETFLAPFPPTVRSSVRKWWTDWGSPSTSPYPWSSCTPMSRASSRRSARPSSSSQSETAQDALLGEVKIWSRSSSKDGEVCRLSWARFNSLVQNSECMFTVQFEVISYS